MRSCYRQPEVEVTLFHGEDVIRTSEDTIISVPDQPASFSDEAEE